MGVTSLELGLKNATRTSAKLWAMVPSVELAKGFAIETPSNPTRVACFGIMLKRWNSTTDAGEGQEASNCEVPSYAMATVSLYTPFLPTVVMSYSNKVVMKLKAATKVAVLTCSS